MEAWKRFRPVNSEMTAVGRKRRDKPRTEQTLIKSIFGKVLTAEILANIHLKLYNFSELEEQILHRKNYKTVFTQFFRDTLEQYKRERVEDTLQEERAAQVPAAEEKIVKDIIKLFIFETDGKH